MLCRQFGRVRGSNRHLHAHGDDPPGVQTNEHLHENHETTIYVLSGEAEVWFGEGLTEHLTMKAGDYVYIPAGVPHLPGNASPDVPCVSIIARTDANEQERVVLRPDFDGGLTRKDEG